MKTLTLIVAAIVLSLTIFFQSPASAQQVQPQTVQNQPKEAIKASIPEPINVSGGWEWRIIPTDSKSRYESTFDTQLTQDGETVKGSFDCLNCTRIVNKAPIKGTLKDRTLQLVREDMAYSGFELTVVTRDSMTGTYVGRNGVRYEVVGRRKTGK